MKKIHICFHIAAISNCGGTEQVTTQISNLLLKNYNYYDISILSTFYDKNIGPFFKGNKKIKYSGIFSEKTNIKLKYLTVVKKIHNYIKNNNVDVLVGVDTIQSLFDLPATKNTKCKYIAWEHFNYNFNLGVKMRDYGRKYAAKKADALVVLTDKDKKIFQKNLKIKTKILRIYNPFILPNNNFKYDSKCNIILSSGRLTYQKGFDMLLEVAKLLKEKTKNFKWLILGEGEDRFYLEQKIKDYGLEDVVELKGRVNNVSEYYKKSKMFVLTSRFEGLVLVILEAKSYGLPIVSFNCDCGPDEMIKNNVNGYLIDNFEVEKMCNKIYDLLCNEEKCLQFSKNSNLGMENFNENTIIKEWDRLFKELLEGN